MTRCAGDLMLNPTARSHPGLRLSALTEAVVDARPAELLLIEDNAGDVLLVREALRSAKICNALAVAGTGETALSMLRREGPHRNLPRPDLILLDLNLPRISGRQVLDAIRTDPDLRKIPVIAMASSPADVDDLKSDGLDVDGYAVKPIEFENLATIVASIDSLWFSVEAHSPSSAPKHSHAR
jgi:chemotaxis family two-component system response regulator Rcp1